MGHHSKIILCALLGTAPLVAGCEQGASANVEVEKLPDITPNLPEVPTLPPPPHPVQYDDQSYSVFGVRRAMRRTLDTDVSVTGYIVQVFQAPDCNPKRSECPPPPPPHFFLADTPTETDATKRLLVAGYAENQAEVDKAMRRARRVRRRANGEGAIPVDLYPHAKVKVSGKFAHVSGSGFQSSEGVLDYLNHETLERSPEDPRARRR